MSALARFIRFVDHVGEVCVARDADPEVRLAVPGVPAEVDPYGHLAHRELQISAPVLFEVLHHPRLGPTAAVILQVMACLAELAPDRRELVIPYTQRQIATAVGLNQHTVGEWIHKLTLAGYLIEHHQERLSSGRFGAAVYRLPLQDPARASAAPGTPTAPEPTARGNPDPGADQGERTGIQKPASGPHVIHSHEDVKDHGGQQPVPDRAALRARLAALGFSDAPAGAALGPRGDALRLGLGELPGFRGIEAFLATADPALVGAWLGELTQPNLHGIANPGAFVRRKVGAGEWPRSLARAVPAPPVPTVSTPSAPPPAPPPSPLAEVLDALDPPTRTRLRTRAEATLPPGLSRNAAYDQMVLAAMVMLLNEPEPTEELLR